MPKSQTQKLQAVSAKRWPIIGHAKIVSYLQRSLDRDELAHAYLLVGPQHLGKTTLAQYFVNGIIDGSSPAPTPSLEDNEFRFHPDIHWVVRATNDKTDKLRKNISIEQVRTLQNQLALSSFLNTNKVGIITEAQALSAEAANALLKTLEEPTPKTVLILIADHVSNLPQTIVSRCQILKFLPVASSEIFDHLRSLHLDQKKAKHVAALAFGRPGIALNLAQNPQAYSEYLAGSRSFLTLLKANTVERFKAVADLVKLNDLEEIYQILAQWSAVLRDCLTAQQLSSSAVAHAGLSAELERAAEQLTPKKLLSIFSELEKTKLYMKANVNPKLALENLILNF